MIYGVVVLFRGLLMQFSAHNKQNTNNIVAVVSEPASSLEESILKPMQPSNQLSLTWKPHMLDVHQQQGSLIGEEIAETKDQEDAKRLNSRGGNSGIILSSLPHF